MYSKTSVQSEDAGMAQLLELNDVIDTIFHSKAGVDGRVDLHNALIVTGGQVNVDDDRIVIRDRKSVV